MKAAVDEFLRGAGIDVSATAWLQLDEIFERMTATNREYNLTRITGYDEFLVKHVADSLLVAAAIPDFRTPQTTVADVGCGAGFSAPAKRPVKILIRKVFEKSLHRAMLQCSIAASVATNAVHPEYFCGAASAFVASVPETEHIVFSRRKRPEAGDFGGFAPGSGRHSRLHARKRATFEVLYCRLPGYMPAPST